MTRTSGFPAAAGDIPLAGMDAEVLCRLTGVTDHQAGAISATQLASLDVTPEQARALCRRGVLVRAAAHVFVLAGAPPTPERGLHVGRLCLGPDAVVSHWAAARLHGFDGAPADAVAFTVLRGGRGRVVDFELHTTARWGQNDRVRVAGFLCTSATRTILDLAHIGVSRTRLQEAMDSAVRSGASSPSVLAARLATLRGPGRRGVRAVTSLLPDTGGHSWLERRFLALVRAARLPRPAMQVIHRRDGRTVARVDFLWEEAGVVVEVSGRRGHASDAERAKDAQRRNELQDLGRVVYEFTRADVVDRAPYVIATVRAGLDRRSRHGNRA